MADPLRTELLPSLGASAAVRRDGCGLPTLNGSAGHVTTWDDHGGGYLLYCSPGSVRLWSEAKKDLAFCELAQDGDDEGCFRLRGLPTPAQAAVIRRRLGLRKRRAISEVERARLRSLGFTTNRDFSAGDAPEAGRAGSGSDDGDVTLKQPSRRTRKDAA